MVTLSLMDGMHLRKNPWRNTAFGQGDLVVASDPTGGASQAQQRQQQALAEAASQTFSECSGLDGMSRNQCRAREISSRLR